MSGIPYSDEEKRFILDAIEKGFAVEDFLLELNDIFGNGRARESVKSFLKRNGIAYKHLIPSHRKKQAKQSEELQQKILEKLENAVQKTDEQRRIESLRQEELRRKATFEQREYRRLLGQETVALRILDVVRDTAKRLPVPTFKKHKPKKGGIVESAMLNIGDAHIGEVVSAESTNGFNSFDFETFEKRYQKVIEKTISYTQNTLKGYRFPTLYINFLGDMMSGMIHEELLKSPNMPVIQSVVKAAPIIAAGINECTKHFEKVVVTWIDGNHGRYTKKVEYKNPSENIEYMFGSMIQLHAQNNPRIEWHIRDSIFTDVVVGQWRFLLMHGESIMSWLGVPYYGIDRAIKKLVALYAKKDQFLDYFIFGHFHVTAQLDQVRGEAFLNGSLKGADEYSLGKYHSFSKPRQLLFGVHEKYGVTWRLPIDLE